ncbi:MAG: pantetheine-phosphate adenylyltransferase [Spirochaetaceae bacterium]|jgi:pantetheine-phosphate adenylyltransferase|nr:pantetheine-phosphate adenylyltransferase [Spirochaetaceae bacterium]
MLHAVFPGTFDPPTFGHLNIIERAAPLFEKLTVLIAENRQKRQLLTPAERLALLTEMLEPWAAVSVALCDSLVVQFMQEQGARVIVRGVRTITDFAYEAEVAAVNRLLNPALETFFMLADTRYGAISSSAVKEIVAFGGDVSGMVAPPVLATLHRKGL